MTLEQKAKAYDEALAKAKEVYQRGYYISGDIEIIFPELVESEDERIRKAIVNMIEVHDENSYHFGQYSKKEFLACLEKQKPIEQNNEDERIRKVLINYLKMYKEQEECGINTFYGIPTDSILAWLGKQSEPTDKGEISDGYHTFNELYYYRMLYNAAFFNMLPKEWVHKSKRHNDGEECFGGGWFIVMANLPTGQISNHYELKDWDLFQIPEKKVADKWDGHTPQEAAERLYKYLLEKQGDNNNQNWKPTKEQINALEHFVRSVGESGYASPYDNNTKQLYSLLNDLKELSRKQVTKKSDKVWSEEDESICKDLISYFNYNPLKYSEESVCNWLKSIKERMQ